MKLSEAILLGSINTEQAFGVTNNGIASCAWGAALHAIGADRQSIYFHFHTLRKEWPWVLTNSICCPLCQYEYTIMGMIIHLNDIHHMTRPKIAAFIEMIEPQTERAPETESRSSASDTPLVLEHHVSR